MANVLFNSTLWMLTKYKVSVHTSLCLNLGKTDVMLHPNFLRCGANNIYFITIKAARLQQKT